MSTLIRVRVNSILSTSTLPPRLVRVREVPNPSPSYYAITNL
jgi:hypothetical protein